MPSPSDLTPIVNAFPTNRAGIVWTMMIALVTGGGGYAAGYSIGGARVSVLEDRLKIAQEGRSTYQVRITQVTAENPYRVQATDDVVQVNLSADEDPVVLLPSGFLIGKTVSLKDKKGNSSKRQIIVRAEGGTIDGLDKWTIDGDYGSIGFVWDGKQWSAY
jgi:hypothetical protein